VVRADAIPEGWMALDIGPGDEVITTSRTFIASASCAVMPGARPVFADVDRVSQNITAESIRAVLTPATKAIIAVHLAGWPCEMDEIMALAREHGLKVIEDCAQAHGATYKGHPVGSIGDIGAFSFCQDKIIAAGGRPEKSDGLRFENGPGRLIGAGAVLVGSYAQGRQGLLPG